MTKMSKVRLAGSVCVIALATGLGSAAQAACTVNGTAVTCTAESTAAEVNAAMATVVGGDVTLTIGSGATVIQPNSQVAPTQQGAVAIANAGDLGVAAARVDVFYFGTSTAATNTFNLGNTGSISGSVSAFDVGGGTTITNSGLIGNGVSVASASAAPVIIDNSGTIDADGGTGIAVNTIGAIGVTTTGNVGTAATATDASDLKDIFVTSDRQVASPMATTVTTDGTATTTTTTNANGTVVRAGGAVSVAVGADSNTGQITALGLTSAEVTVDGTVGSETDAQGVFARANNFQSQRTVVNTVDGANSSNSDTTVRTAVGGQADIDVGGTVFGSANANGLAGASVSVGGTLGREGATGNASAMSNGFNRTTRNTNSVVGTVNTSNFSRATDAVGGEATVAVSEDGAVTGGVSATGLSGATITIDGAVGLPTASSFASASSTGNSDTLDQSSTFNSATGVQTFSRLTTNSAVGGDASVSVGETGVLNGSTSSNANGDAGIANAGTITGSAFASAFGNENASTQESVSDGVGNFANANTQSSATTGGTATITNAANARIGASATSPVQVGASGDTAASVTNAGRINGNVSAEASGQSFEAEFSEAGTFAIDATTMVETRTYDRASSNSTTSLGGDATVTNAQTGLITGSVDVNGQGGVTVTNNGAVIGTTFANSSFDNQESTSVFSQTSVFTPGADGGQVFEAAGADTFSRTATGGDVTGTYAGSNGAVQFAPFGGASDGSVAQIADGNSTAVVTGAIFGSFSGTAGDDNFSNQSGFANAQVLDADGDLRSQTSSNFYQESQEFTNSTSTLAVNGGTITGNATLFATGSASAQLGNGAELGGSLSVTARSDAGYDYAEAEESASLFDEDGNFVSGTSNSVESFEQRINSGAASVTIGEASVGGNVNINGTSGANTFTLAANGSVGGGVFQSSNATAFASDVERASVTVDGDTTTTIDSASTFTSGGGNVTATVAGTIGLGGADEALEYGDVVSAGGTNLQLSTNNGSAAATLTGQVRNGIRLIASGNNNTFASQETQLNGATTAFASQSSSTAVGGTASLVVNAADTDIPANFGDILVFGRSGSSVTIGANSTVLAAQNGAFMQVGNTFADTTNTQTNTYTGTRLTGQAFTSRSTIVGGPATLLNNGRIGFDGGNDFDGDNAFVTVISPTSATATNNGAIYGSLNVRSLVENFASTTTRTNVGDVTRVDVTDRTYTGTGGTATLTNAGLITGDASLSAITGTVTNNGVLRGDLDLGANVDNYTTRSTDTLTQIGEEEVVTTPAPITQTYAVAQNGLLGGIVSVSGAFGQIDDDVRTSNIAATINLNSGSVTGGGVVAEYDDETGARFTATTVNLNGSGYLGIGNIALDALEDAFAATDPGIAIAGDLSAFAGGARVLGVDALNKTGSGVFLITGADFAPASNTNRSADYTLDIGTFTIAGGEVQLDTTTSDGVFGIRGNTVNNAGLVLGSRVIVPAPLFGTNASVTAIDGVEVYQRGNFTQSATGTLTVGATPSLVRVSDPAFASISLSSNPLAVQQIPLASGLFTTPERALGQMFANLGTGFLTVDGNLALAGTVALATPTGGLFTNGQRIDIASVSGTVSATANVVSNARSNFVKFGLATRSEGGRTIVFVGANRAGFETVGNNTNAIAAGTALTAALPGVVTRIRAGSAGGIGLNGDQFVLAQDLANIFVAFDSLLTTDQVAQALNELASGEFYGSLTALPTTAPFVDAISTRRLAENAEGFNIWLAPSGDFIRLAGDAAVGSSRLKADNYGMTMGFGVATGSGEVGIGAGYGRIDASAREDLLNASADTIMIGAYARHAFGPISVGADLVYGWSDWDAARVMPLMSREATAAFDSSELRGTLRVDYTLDLGGGWVAPFAQVEMRKFNFDGFTEEGAGAVSLVVQESKDTEVTPTLGLRAGTEFETSVATLRPEITVAYNFRGNADTHRDVAYLGAQDTGFRLQGVEPEGNFTIGAGLFADIGANSGAFLRGSHSTGGGVKASSVNVGVTIGF